MPSIQKVELVLTARYAFDDQGEVFFHADDLVTDLSEFTSKLENSGVRATLEQVTKAIQDAAAAIKTND